MHGDANELEAVDIPDWLTIILLLDRIDGHYSGDGNWTGTRLYEISHDENSGSITSQRLSDTVYLGLSEFGDSDELDMSSPDTLEGFMNFVQAEYPADNYGLFFSDHGDGWTKGGGQKNPVYKGLCTDDTSGGSSLSIQNHVGPLVENMGLKVIGFDACLMGMIEVAWVFKDSVDYMMASQALEPGDGWDYTQWLNSWISGNPTAKNLAITEVQTYGDFYSPYYGWGDCTQSAIDLSKMDALGDAIDGFASSNDVEDNLGYMVDGYFYDLWDVADNGDDDNLKQAIEEAVIENWSGDGGNVPAGLSIDYSSDEEYEATQFCQDTDWC